MKKGGSKLCTLYKMKKKIMTVGFNNDVEIFTKSYSHFSPKYFQQFHTTAMRQKNGSSLSKIQSTKGVFQWCGSRNFVQINQLHCKTVCKFFGSTGAPHRGAFCQFPFRWIYYSHSSKSTGKETGKTHLCGVCGARSFSQKMFLALVFRSKYFLNKPNLGIKLNLIISKVFVLVSMYLFCYSLLVSYYPRDWLPFLFHIDVIATFMPQFFC